ncbi:MAG: DUF262 domain-containing protein [Spirochaetia bacterium]|nr:DUF262 domain-containing protein [Spirochaetia bacterium]
MSNNVISVQQFFVGKRFTIPHYQRDYAWTKKQIQDLLSDIEEAIDTNSGHYLGTVVLAETGTNTFDLVDGQQRISTITLVAHAMLGVLPNNDRFRITFESNLVEDHDGYKLSFGRNKDFTIALLKGSPITPETAGQRKLGDAYKYAREHAEMVLRNNGEDKIKELITTLASMEMISFEASDTGKAIRMFQTVNDRGLP